MKGARLAPVSSCTCYYQSFSCLMLFFLSFLTLNSVFLLTVDVGVYCCTLSHLMKHNRWDFSGRVIGPNQRTHTRKHIALAHKKQTSLSPAEFEPETYTLDRATTDFGQFFVP